MNNDIKSAENLFFKRIYSLFFVCAYLLINIGEWKEHEKTDKYRSLKTVTVSMVATEDISELSVVVKIVCDCNKLYSSVVQPRVFS